MFKSKKYISLLELSIALSIKESYSIYQLIFTGEVV